MQNTPAWHSYKAVDIDGSWYKTTFIQEVVAELNKKAAFVQAGLDEFSKAEMLAAHILNESNHDFLWVGRQTNEEND